ncbi:MAG: hypothetical protein WC069_04135 [Candidatus Shapirobacteria bacterium]
MNKKQYFFLWFIVLFLISSQSSLAYNLNIDVSRYGYVSYSTPSVLGDNNQSEVHKSEDKKEKDNKKEVKETPRVEKPEKIEVKNEENKIKIELKKQEKIQQTLNPQKAILKFPVSPKTTPIHQPEVNGIGNSTMDDSDDVLKARSERKDEKIEIQGETRDDGTVELQIESRAIKAKIKNSEIELDVKNNNVGVTDNDGNKIELVHLPDQAMTKFLETGISMAPDTLEVGQSGDNFEYTVEAVKIKKLFGLIPRETKFKLSLNDGTGAVEQKAISISLADRLLNLFSF